MTAKTIAISYLMVSIRETGLVGKNDNPSESRNETFIWEVINRPALHNVISHL